MIRPARLAEAEALTKISFDSKGYWGYPKEFFDIWSSELTINSAYIENNDVFVFEEGGTIVGYYSLVELKDDLELSGIRIKKGFWLEHMFVLPASIGKGLGSKLFIHLREMCSKRNINEVGILADPHARGFYERMGCEYKGEYPSTINNRTTPFLLLKIEDNLA